MLVRLARPEDGPRFLELLQELADFEKLAGPTPEARARLLEDAFGTRPRFTLHVAELEGEVVAYAVSFPTYGTFRAQPVLYLEDLYVTPRARRRGIARALLAAVARHAVASGCYKMSWVVLDWNVDAQKVYDLVGASRDTQWVPYSIQDDALRALAQPG